MICEPFLVFQSHFRIIKCVFGLHRSISVRLGLPVVCLPPERETVSSGGRAERSWKLGINPTKTSKSLKNLKMKIIWPQIREFCACIFYRLSHCVLRRFWQKCATLCPLSFCRKGLAGLRRGPYGVATGLPLSPDGAAVATPGGPPDSAAAFFWRKTETERENDGVFPVPPFLFCDFSEALF